MRQTTLRLDEALYREAKADAARQGTTLTRYLEEALRDRLAAGERKSNKREDVLREEARSDRVPSAEEIAARDALMESLLSRMAHFRMGPKPTREEMNER